MSRSRFRVGHAGKGAAKVSARSGLMGRLRLIERIDQLGGRLKVRSAQSRLGIGQVLGQCRYTCFESAEYAIVAVVWVSSYRQCESNAILRQTGKNKGDLQGGGGAGVNVLLYLWRAGCVRKLRSTGDVTAQMLANPPRMSVRPPISTLKRRPRRARASSSTGTR